MTGNNILQGKAAFVAGGSGGINLGIARALAAAGARVALASRSAERIEAAAAGLRGEGHQAIGIVADVRDYTAIDHALARAQAAFGPLDVIVSGAAGNFFAPATSLSANGFKTVVEIDLQGTFNVFRASHAYLRKPGAALIAVTAPQAERPMLQQVHACAAKAGVNMVTKCLALEWGADGIRVNAISPGPIADTEGMRRLSGSPDWEAAYKAALPLRRYGTKQEIGDLAVFLASDAAAYVTGAILNCDGGASLTSAPPVDL